MPRSVKRLLSGALTAMMTVLTLSVAAPASAETVNTSVVIADLAAKAKPSVVGILTTTKSETNTNAGRSAGTGFVYKPGVIITNAHVVNEASEVRILYHDMKVEVVQPANVFVDEKSDVAVVKIKRTDLPVVTFSDSEALRVGQQVVAIGNPLGFRLGNSVTSGIVSGVGRALGSGYPFLQTDAPINPGNSGGPLFNLEGHVVGINSAKMAELGVEGLGFAIPSNTAIDIADALLKDGRIERATIGIMFYEDWQAYFGVPDAEGVTIANVISDGPAGLAALRPGDKLIRLNDTTIHSEDDINSFLTSRKPGDVVTLVVRRQGQEFSVSIKLGSLEDLRQEATAGGTESQTGILIDLTAGQIQAAVAYGEELATGWEQPNQDYFAISGSSYAVLYTEYLYVARRMASVHEFGFRPSVGFQQQVAKEINQKIELQMELVGDEADFLKGATYSLVQGSKTIPGSVSATGPVYTTASDDSTRMARLGVRFSTATLNATDDLKVTVRAANGKSWSFTFRLGELR